MQILQSFTWNPAAQRIRKGGRETRHFSLWRNRCRPQVNRRNVFRVGENVTERTRTCSLRRKCVSHNSNRLILQQLTSIAICQVPNLQDDCQLSKASTSTRICYAISQSPEEENKALFRWTYTFEIVYWGCRNWFPQCRGIVCQKFQSLILWKTVRVFEIWDCCAKQGRVTCSYFLLLCHSVLNLVALQVVLGLLERIGKLVNGAQLVALSLS